jgi:hypothetical protein
LMTTEMTLELRSAPTPEQGSGQEASDQGTTFPPPGNNVPSHPGSTFLEPWNYVPPNPHEPSKQPPGNPQAVAADQITGELLTPDTSLPMEPTRKVAKPTDHLHAEFDQWWQWVPKKVDKAEASRLFRHVRTKKQVSFENLLASMMAYARQFAPLGAADPQYSTGPAKWLHGERWNDEPPAPATARRPAGKPNETNGIFGALLRRLENSTDMDDPDE